MMKIATMPGLEFQIFGSELAKQIGAKFIVAPKTNDKLIQYSDRISPENWCLDIKLMYGWTSWAIARGADTIFLFHYAFPLVNIGPCLMPWACDSYFPQALKKLYPKKNFQIFSMDWWQSARLAIKITAALRKAGINNPTTILKVKKAMETGWIKIKYLHEVRDKYYRIGAVDYKKYSKIYKKFIDYLIKETDLKKIKELKDEIIAVYNGANDKAKKLPKIGIVGDFYTLVLDNYPFFDIEELLINKLKVSVYQPFSLYTIHDRKTNKLLKPYVEKSKKYIKYWIGGSDSCNIPQTLKLKDEQVDGIIHAAVFACHPEAVTRNVINMIDEIDGLPPVLNLSFDSHTQTEAVKVRLEAFIDMIEENIRRKRKI